MPKSKRMHFLIIIGYKKGTRMKKKTILTIIICLLMITSIFGTGCNFGPQPVSADGTDQGNATPEPTRELAVATSTPDPRQILTGFNTEIDQDIINILLIGDDSDSPDGDGNGRNDTTMVLQINRVDKTMKLISFMRDMVFDIPGHGKDALNNANYSGGPYRVEKLLSQYFDLEIDYYAAVSFVAFQSILDTIGRVAVNVQKTDVETLYYQSRIEKETEEDLDIVDTIGTFSLGSLTALTYVRNRHDRIVDEETGYTLYSDEARNYRQRNFIVSAWETVKNYDTFLVPVAVLGAIVYVDTDMDAAMIITLISEMMDSNATIETLGLPARRSAQKPYYSLYKNLSTDVILAKSEVEVLYNSASDKDEYESYEEWFEANYKVSHIIGWNVGRTTAAIDDFLITN